METNWFEYLLPIIFFVLYGISQPIQTLSVLAVAREC